MNYIKAQKEVFAALCSGKKLGRFDVDGNNVLVTPNGYMGYIFPNSIICFSLDKIPEIKSFQIKEFIQDQYLLTITPDLRIVDAHRTARRLKGNGKNVLVNTKFLSCFQNPRFYQAENPMSGIVVTESIYRNGQKEENPVGFILPIIVRSVGSDYYTYADNLEGADGYAETED